MKNLLLKNIVLLLLLPSALFVSCKKEHVTAVACFHVDGTETVETGHNFQFRNCSQNYESLQWDFGDGTFSTEENPGHTYASRGNYVVTLTVTDETGNEHSAQQTITYGSWGVAQVVVHKTWSVPPPKMVSITYSFFPIEDTLFSFAQLPLTLQATNENTYYAVHEPFETFGYFEFDFISQGGDRLFDVYPSAIVNRKLDVEVVSAWLDTARFTMYFKIVPE